MVNWTPRALGASLLIMACHVGVQAPPPPATPPSGPPQSDEEVCAVRDAILRALRESPTSETPWAPALAERTRAASCQLEADGTARIGQWSLRPCVEDCESVETMRFVYREPGEQTPSYAAEVHRTGEGFRCSNLGQFHVIPTEI